MTIAIPSLLDPRQIDFFFRRQAQAMQLGKMTLEVLAPALEVVSVLFAVHEEVLTRELINHPDVVAQQHDVPRCLKVDFRQLVSDQLQLLVDVNLIGECEQSQNHQYADSKDD